MEMAFYIGQKVVCVDASSGVGSWVDNDGPTEGAIYTVSRAYRTHDGYPYLQFFELARGPICRATDGGDAGYRAHRFRPVQERKTDIAWAHELVAPKQRERVPT
jgi:hypothetical protein